MFGSAQQVSITSNSSSRDRNNRQRRLELGPERAGIALSTDTATAAALAGDIAAARDCNDRLLPLHRRLFVEPNPTPVKWALAEMGLIRDVLRLPLVALSPQHHDAVHAALRDAGCLT